MSNNRVSNISTSQQKSSKRATRAIFRCFQFLARNAFGVLGVVHIVMFFYLLGLPFTASAASLADKMAPEIPYYYEHFDPGQRPWKPGGNMNIEEVFKNYQFYEIVLDEDGKELTVIQYIRGDKASSEKYLVLPDGSLQKK